jgi:CheY-like chemotaxis protein
VAHTVVIGDDHEQMRRLIVEVLEAQGYEIREASDTHGVLDAVADFKPDLLILDVHMPGGGGIEALGRIRSNPACNGTRVLLLSGSMEALDADWAARVGADDHLPKPFPVEDLKSKVRALLAS